MYVCFFQYIVYIIPLTLIISASVSIEKFLNTYFQTTTPSTLIRKLIQRYNVPRKIAPGLSDVEFHVKVSLSLSFSFWCFY